MIKKNISLKAYNTFGVEAATRYFAEAKTITELEAILAWYRTQKDCPLLVLGGGSNLLFTRDWSGLTLKLSLRGKMVVEPSDTTPVLVSAGAGESWHDFVLWTLEKGFNGLENLSLIPGQVGTAPLQNIGAYGVEIKDVLWMLEAVEIKTGKLKIFTAEECEFGYRESVFKNKEKDKWLIVSVQFALLQDGKTNTDYGTIKTTLQAHGITKPTPKQVSQAVTAIRQAKLPDPKKLGSAGSFFKNPVVKKSVLESLKANYPDVPYYAVKDEYKLPAGWLIEKAGWKGHNRGTHGVHKDQALVLVNYGGATGEDLWQLAKDIKAEVAFKFKIDLIPEVNVI